VDYSTFLPHLVSDGLSPQHILPPACNPKEKHAIASFKNFEPPLSKPETSAIACRAWCAATRDRGGWEWIEKTALCRLNKSDGVSSLTYEASDGVTSGLACKEVLSLHDSQGEVMSPTEYTTALENLDLYHAAGEVLVNLPSPRSKAYMNSNFDEVQATLNDFSTEVQYKVGFADLQV